MTFVHVAVAPEDLGLAERVKGSHHIFTEAEVAEILNLQPRGSTAKPH